MVSPLAKELYDVVQGYCETLLWHQQPYRIVMTESEVTVLVEVFADREHLGFLIGSQGCQIAALRKRIGHLAYHASRRVHVKLIREEAPAHE